MRRIHPIVAGSALAMLLVTAITAAGGTTAGAAGTREGHAAGRAPQLLRRAGHPALQHPGNGHQIPGDRDIEGRRHHLSDHVRLGEHQGQAHRRDRDGHRPPQRSAEGRVQGGCLGARDQRHGTAVRALPHPDTTTTYTSVPFPNQLLAQNWEIVGSDYQGEGTPGPLPYLVGALAAHNTLDLVRGRAARVRLPREPHLRRLGPLGRRADPLYSLTWHTPTAPTLHLVGVVAGAPPSQLSLVYTFVKTSPFRFYLLMVAGGYNAAYGAASLRSQRS